MGLALRTKDKRNIKQLGPKTMCEEGVSYEVDVKGNYSLDLEELRGRVIWKVLSFYIWAEVLETVRKEIAFMDNESLKRMTTCHKSHK